MSAATDASRQKWDDSVKCCRKQHSFYGSQIQKKDLTTPTSFLKQIATLTITSFMCMDRRYDKVR